MDPAEFVDQIVAAIKADLARPLTDEDRGRIAAIAPHIQERTKLLSEIGDQVSFILVDEVEFDEASWAKVMVKPGVADVLDEAATRLAAIDDWDVGSIENTLRSMIADLEIGAGKGFQPIRVAVSGSTVSPPLFESLEVLGRDQTLDRVNRARQMVG
jgi:glutamyl-tRNA synthetase